MKKMLIVDDNELIRLSLESWFRSQMPDLSILTASNGKEAVDLMNRAPVACIITDLQMPVLDGFGLIAYRNAVCPEVPLFAMTAEFTPVLKDRLGRLGVQHCLEKPFDMDSLVPKVRESLEHAASDQGRLVHAFVV